MKSPCNPDHNGECLICDCWLSECAYQRFLNNDYTYETREQFVEMFKEHNRDVVDTFLTEHGIHIYTYPVAPFVMDDEDYPRIVWVSKICSLNQVNFEKFVDEDNGLAVNHHRTKDDAINAAIKFLLKEK